MTYNTREYRETGTQSGWTSRLLERYGHEVLVANSRELHGISQSDHENDRRDERNNQKQLEQELDRLITRPIKAAPPATPTLPFVSQNADQLLNPSETSAPVCQQNDFVSQNQQDRTRTDSSEPLHSSRHPQAA
jgi:hypothetical protein